jgi:hypothetical protein
MWPARKEAVSGQRFVATWRPRRSGDPHPSVDDSAATNRTPTGDFGKCELCDPRYCRNRGMRERYHRTGLSACLRRFRGGEQRGIGVGDCRGPLGIAADDNTDFSSVGQTGQRSASVGYDAFEATNSGIGEGDCRQHSGIAADDNTDFSSVGQTGQGSASVGHDAFEAANSVGSGKVIAASTLVSPRTTTRTSLRLDRLGREVRRLGMKKAG